MLNFVLIAVCLLAGLIFQRLKSLPEDTYKGINAWVLYIALPAVSLKYIPAIHWSTKLIFPAVSPLIVWLGGWLTVTIYSLKYPLDKQTKGALKLSAGLCNTSFLGFPLVAAYFSEKEVGIAIICDQVTFILLCTIGIITAINAAGKEPLSVKAIINKLTKFPPFIAFLVALIVPHFADISPLNPLFDKLAATVAPLALFSIGLQLKLGEWKSEIKNLTVGMVYKLIIAPALVLLFALILRVKGLIPQVSLFEAAMPTLVTGSVVAAEYSLNPKLANLMVGFGILFSFITTAAWWFIISWLL